jgi:hypothetical protein
MRVRPRGSFLIPRGSPSDEFKGLLIGKVPRALVVEELVEHRSGVAVASSLAQ